MSEQTLGERLPGAIARIGRFLGSDLALKVSREFIADIMSLHAAAVSPIGRGVPIGVNDRNGKPIHIGDTLRFDQREFGRQMEFVIELRDGQIQHPGATGDLSSWCEIVKPWDGERTPT